MNNTIAVDKALSKA